MDIQSRSGSGVAVAYEQREGHVAIRVFGPSGSAAALREAWARIAHIASETGARRLLVVEDLPTSGLGPVIEAVATAVAMGLDRCRIAFVDLREGAQAFAEFGAMMARHRGIDAQAFATEADALRWLMLAEGPSLR
jgi:hypothetical protein